MTSKNIVNLTAISVPLAGTEIIPIWNGVTTTKVSVSDLTAGRLVSTGQLNVVSGTLNFGLGGVGTDNAVMSINGSSAASYGPYLILKRNSIAQWHIGCYSGINGGSSNDLTFYSSGNNIRLYNDVKTMNGNLVQGTAAKGFNFTANTPAAGMTSQLLNWYEEGTWTPTLVSAGGAITLNTALTKGLYVRVGKQVTITGLIYITSVASPTGNLRIGNLPFITAADYGGRSAGSVLALNLKASATTSIVMFATGGSYNAYIAKYANGAQSELGPDVQADASFVFSMTYITA